MALHPDLPNIFKTDRAQTAVDRTANAYYEKTLELDPASATIIGRKGRETEYPDYSPAGTKAEIDLARETLVALDALEPADAIDRVTIDAMRERLGLKIEIHEAGLGGWELNNIASPVQGIRAVFDLMNRETSEDWGHITGRLGNVATAVRSYIKTLEAARTAGKVAAVRQIDIVIEQVTAYVAEGGFFDTLAREVAEAAPEHADSAARGAASAKEGYSELLTYLKDTLRPDAPEADAVGRERYSLYSRQFVGTTLDLDETYAWGIEELDRIVAAQQEVAETIKPGATIDEAKALLDADPERTLHGTDELQAWMQELSDAAVGYLAKEHFTIEGPLRKLECMIAPTQEGGIYYTGPSADFERAGRMWWSVPEGEDTFGTWRETSTVYHEGVPGHHLQIAYATAMADALNQWRANAVWVSGHGEGWALYAERLMDELGYLSNPGDRMGMLDAQRLRAARVVFDIGLHCGFEIPERWVAELGVEPGIWDAERGYKFLEANLDMSEGQRRFEFLRYLGWPGQAPSYKVGERIWLQLRDEARSAGISDRDFHTRALMLGSVGLDTLRKALTF
ncbi:DUF885 domain-containing protein [Rothia nasisuis]|uniref:DUF885 domain-containing protein n=1 Tax=Rothia nasisuis TaxID=2109647 RepID=UPI001F2573C5|nr:DUF885 domain-containing protein [Rothia nasisuis]